MKVETQIQTFENLLNLNNTQKNSGKELQVLITILHPLHGKWNLKNLKIPFWKIWKSSNIKYSYFLIRIYNNRSACTMLVGMPIFNHFGKQLKVILSSRKCILHMTLPFHSKRRACTAFTAREERVPAHKDRRTRMYTHAQHSFVT